MLIDYLHATYVDVFPSQNVYSLYTHILVKVTPFCVSIDNILPYFWYKHKYYCRFNDCGCFFCHVCGNFYLVIFSAMHYVCMLDCMNFTR